MFEEGLLRSQVLVAALTKDAVRKPWVIWEIASAWAMKQLVIPVFIDVEPEDIPGPINMRVQGIHLSERDGLDKAVAQIASKLGAEPPEVLTDDEFDSLTGSAV